MKRSGPFSEPPDGGVSRSGLVLPFLSVLGLSRFFWDFPELLRDGPGIFPICPFPLSWPIKSTYEEQSRKGLRHNLDLSQKKWEPPPPFGKPPGLASLKIGGRNVGSLGSKGGEHRRVVPAMAGPKSVRVC